MKATMTITETIFDYEYEINVSIEEDIPIMEIDLDDHNKVQFLIINALAESAKKALALVPRDYPEMDLSKLNNPLAKDFPDAIQDCGCPVGEDCSGHEPELLPYGWYHPQTTDSAYDLRVKEEFPNASVYFSVEHEGEVTFLLDGIHYECLEADFKKMYFFSGNTKEDAKKNPVLPLGWYNYIKDLAFGEIQQYPSTVVLYEVGLVARFGHPISNESFTLPISKFDEEFKFSEKQEE